MMISKDIFIETMLKLDKLEKKMYKAQDALREICPGLEGFFVEEPFDMVLHLLAEIFNDKHDWLGWFIYECDFLRIEPIINDDGQSREFKNWGDVYDFLIKNMEEE